jgi:hypothetical protein
MAKYQKKDPDRPKRIKAAFEDSAYYCDKLQKHHASESSKYGYARDLFQNAADQFGNVSDEPSLAPHEDAIKEFRDYLELKAGQIKPEMVNISTAAFTSTTSTYITTSTITTHTTPFSFNRLKPPWVKPPWVEPDESKELAVRLEKLNPELGKCLRGVWECFNSNSEQPERSALGLMRQLFDHFLDIIAPKKSVRDWLYSQSKADMNLSKIDREQRVEYILRKRASDIESAKLLKSQVPQVLQAYKDLQHLHKRGTLNRDKVRLYLIVMQVYIKQLADSCDL